MRGLIQVDVDAQNFTGISWEWPKEKQQRQITDILVPWHPNHLTCCILKSKTARIRSMVLFIHLGSESIGLGLGLHPILPQHFQYNRATPESKECNTRWNARFAGKHGNRDCNREVRSDTHVVSFIIMEVDWFFAWSLGWLVSWLVVQLVDWVVVYRGVMTEELLHRCW